MGDLTDCPEWHSTGGIIWAPWTRFPLANGRGCLPVLCRESVNKLYTEDPNIEGGFTFSFSLNVKSWNLLILETICWWKLHHYNALISTVQIVLLSTVFLTAALLGAANQQQGKWMVLLGWLFCKRQPITCQVALCQVISASQAAFSFRYLWYGLQVEFPANNL